MAYEVSPYALKVTLTAGADLSSNAQYRFVKLDTSGNVILCSAVTDAPIGVLQNNPASGQEAEVVILGVSKLQVSAAITGANLPTTFLGTATSGKAAAKTLGTDTTNFAVARPLQTAGGDGEYIAAVIDCASPNRAA